MEFSDAAKNSRNQHGGHIALPELLCVVSKKAYLKREGSVVFTHQIYTRENEAQNSQSPSYRLPPKVAPLRLFSCHSRLQQSHDGLQGIFRDVCVFVLVR